MKKFRRILALACALVLLGATAFPSSAHDFEGVYNPYDNNIPPLVDYEVSKSDIVNGTTYLVSGTRIGVSSLDYFSTGYSEYHDGSSSFVMQYGIEEDTYFWYGSADFNPTYRTQWATLASDIGIAYQVGNRSDHVYAEFNSSVERGEYTIYCGCWHYSVSAVVNQGVTQIDSQSITRMPAIDGSYLFISN